MASTKEFIFGCVSFSILLINTFLLALLMIPLGIIKFLIPIKTLRVSFTKIIIKISGISLFFYKNLYIF